MKDALGERLKQKYENCYRIYLPQRTYVIVRLDGRSFHTFTKKLPKPSCDALVSAMDMAATDLAKEMMGCRFAYGQSDEYSFLLTDFEKFESESWFSGNIQKIASVSASIFTATFNQEWKSVTDAPSCPFGVMDLAHFDSRVFVIPDRSEVIKYFEWRQNDATRNSLNMLASCYFSHKDLMGKGSPEKHEMLHGVGVNWAKLPTSFKRGRVVKKVIQERTVTYTHKKTKEVHCNPIQESVWIVDDEIPVFSKTPNYLEKLVPTIPGGFSDD